MTREEIFEACLDKIGNTHCLLLELATGTGKTKLAINLVNHLCSTIYKGMSTRMLLLVANRGHKVTWKEEFLKWGGIRVNEVVMECYESLHKHLDEQFTFIVCDEVHHVGSDIRIKALATIKADYILGLSATIPRQLKSYFRYKYHAQTVSCDIIDAIEDNVLPEPEIVLFPLQLDNRDYNQTWEINPRAKGPIVYGKYTEIWKYKKQKAHAILSCTQKQKSNELNAQVLYWKNQFTKTRNEIHKQIWLHTCGQRLEYYADIKLPVVKDILHHLKRFRTITFCKTIPQAEAVGRWCIHSKNGRATQYYDDFNNRRINHITAVNILNENANLVDCKYAIFCNFSSSDTIPVQRLGRSMRHKHPVIILPYYDGTREQELAEKLIEGFNKDFIRVIHSVKEI